MTLTTWTLRPAGSEPIEPATFAQRAGAFTSRATTVVRRHITLVTTRDEDGLHPYYVTSDPEAHITAKQLASALGAKADKVDGVPELTGPGARWVSQALMVSNNVGGMSQQGADSGELMSTLAESMPVGSWVGMSVRTASKAETSKWQTYLTTRIAHSDAHASKQTNNPVVASIYAAGATREDSRALLRQTCAALPGFDVSVRPYSPTRVVPAVVTALLGLLLAAAIVYGLPAAWGLVTGIFPEMGAVPDGGPLARASVITGLALGAGMILGVVPTRRTRLLFHLKRGTLPRPFWRFARAEVGDTATFNQAEAKAGEYPLDRRSFVLAPHQAVQIVSPTGGVLSGDNETRARALPLPLTERVGPMIGMADSGQRAYLSAADLRYGLSAVGAAGSGKSVALETIVAWTMADRARGMDVPGALGKRNGLIVIEPKREGADSYLDWSRRLGDTTRVVEVANPASLSLDLFHIPGADIETTAAFATEALRYAFDDGEIKGRSAEALRAALAGGMCVTDDMIEHIRAGDSGDTERPEVRTGSYMHYAHLLLGAMGDDVAVAMFDQIKARAQREVSQEGDTEVSAIVASLQTMFGPGRTPASRAAYCEAPRNKLDAFRGIDHFFSTKRKRRSWDKVLNRHYSLVILTGTSSSGHKVSGTTSKYMSALLVFTLKEAIERTCEGWEKQNRGTTLVIDELRDVAGSNPEIVEWFKQRGRSYGLMVVMATQNLGQLGAEVRAAFLSNETLLAFQQSGTELARHVIDNIAGDGGTWSADDLTMMPKYAAIVRTAFRGRRQSGFTVKTAYWGGAGEDSREMFYEDQVA